jgi:Rieske Fe-S protein
MNRKEFLQTCAGTCAVMIGLQLTYSCSTTRHVQGIISNNQLQIEKKEFKVVKNGKESFRKSIISKPDHFDFPIVIYRFSENNYTALLLRCTHQGSELNLNGDILTCPAHGSEFNKRGEPIQGPAEQQLQSFKIINTDKLILIELT